MPQPFILFDVVAPSPGPFEALPFHNKRFCLLYRLSLPTLLLVQWRLPLHDTFLPLHFDWHISHNRLPFFTRFSMSDFLHAHIIVVSSISRDLDHLLNRLLRSNELNHKWHLPRRSVRDWHLEWSNYRTKMFNTPRLRYFSYIKIQSVIIMNSVLSQEVGYNQTLQQKLLFKTNSTTWKLYPL